MQPMKITHHFSRALVYYSVLTALYLIFSLVLPPNHTTQATYHLSSLQYHILLFVIILPLIIIWFIAFYGYSAIKDYATVLEDSEEGEAVRHISTGLMWLAWGLPIPSIISLLASAIANSHPGFYHASIIISNYASLIMPLIAFHILSTGSHKWTEKEGVRLGVGSVKLLVFLFVAIGATYCYFIFRNIGSLTSDTTANPYFLPAWLILSTIVVPYMYAWFIGFLAAYEIQLVSKHINGVLYRQALQHMARGLIIIVASSITLQYFRTVLPANGSLSLGYLLVIVYLLLIVIGGGYALLAYGTRKLRRIEEI